MGPSNHDVGRATRGEGRAFLGKGRGRGVRHVLASAMELDAARNRARGGGAWELPAAGGRAGPGLIGAFCGVVVASVARGSEAVEASRQRPSGGVCWTQEVVMMRVEVRLEFFIMEKFIPTYTVRTSQACSRLKLKRTDNKRIGGVSLMPACTSINCIA